MEWSGEVQPGVTLISDMVKSDVNLLGWWIYDFYAVLASFFLNDEIGRAHV